MIAIGFSPFGFFEREFSFLLRTDSGCPGDVFFLCVFCIFVLSQAVFNRSRGREWGRGGEGGVLLPVLGGPGVRGT